MTILFRRTVEVSTYYWVCFTTHHVCSHPCRGLDQKVTGALVPGLASEPPDPLSTYNKVFLFPSPQGGRPGWVKPGTTFDKAPQPVIGT